MNKPVSLVRFAQETIQKNDTLKFPGSPDVQSLKSRYVELRVSDSEGKSTPVSDLLHHGSRLVLVGDPGSGKTTALKYFAILQSEEFLAGRKDLLPIYLPLRHIPFGKGASLLDAAGLGRAELGRTPILALLDGLDELQPDARIAALGLVSQLSADFPASQIILASRPAGLSPLPPDEFRFYHLESLDTAQAREFLAKLADNTSQRERFEASLESASFLQGLSQNPLLIQLLWEVYRHEVRLPAVRADLYQTACDFLLSTWDAAKGISERQQLLDVHSVHRILEAIAFEAFHASQYRIPFSQVRGAVVEYFKFTGFPEDRLDSVMNQLLSSGILIRLDSDSIAFVHLTFLEFYAAKRLVKSPRKLASLLIEAGPMAKETILFAAGMILDVGPLVESAVDRRELILAANCLREGRTENRVLEAYVIDQLQRELGPDLIRKLGSGVTEDKRPQPESIHSTLKRQLAKVRDADLPSHQKGKCFEQFMERFFRQTFHVVDVNRNTENGEIDLILENTARDPFWAEYGGDIFVECKNWDTSRPLKETAAFCNKVRMSRGRLGFFVSMSGFTEDAVAGQLKTLFSGHFADLHPVRWIRDR